MLSVIYDECHYAKCRYAECRYAECRGAATICRHDVCDSLPYLPRILGRCNEGKKQS
jgi:hypothetical protein